jgi:hypothetical protein
MEPVALMRCLTRLQDRANETVEAYVDSTRDERRAVVEATFTLAACGDIAVKLTATDAIDSPCDVDPADSRPAA